MSVIKQYFGVYKIVNIKQKWVIFCRENCGSFYLMIIWRVSKTAFYIFEYLVVFFVTVSIMMFFNSKICVNIFNFCLDNFNFYDNLVFDKNKVNYFICEVVLENTCIFMVFVEKQKKVFNIDTWQNLFCCNNWDNSAINYYL